MTFETRSTKINTRHFKDWKLIEKQISFGTVDGVSVKVRIFSNQNRLEKLPQPTLDLSYSHSWVQNIRIVSTLVPQPSSLEPSTQNRTTLSTIQALDPQAEALNLVPHKGSCPHKHKESHTPKNMKDPQTLNPK